MRRNKITNYLKPLAVSFNTGVALVKRNPHTAYGHRSMSSDHRAHPNVYEGIFQALVVKQWTSYPIAARKAALASAIAIRDFSTNDGIPKKPCVTPS